MNFMVRKGYLHPTVSSSVAWGFRAIFPSAPGCGRAFYSQAGFSLLELLLVLFILGLMATSAALLTQGVEDQSKYDETKRRMEMIKRAIIGDASRTINGGPEISGFVADMGRLPECLAELIEVSGVAPNFVSPCNGDPIKTWDIDEDTGIGRGWNGPYIDLPPSSSSERILYDGFGCEFTFESIASQVNVESLGADCEADGDGYSADISASGVNALVGEDDWLSRDTIIINLFNRSAFDVEVASGVVSLESATHAVNDIDSNIFAFQNGVSTIPAGGNMQATARFSNRVSMGPYNMDVVLAFNGCASCVSVSAPYHITLLPRHHVPSFQWVIDTE